MSISYLALSAVLALEPTASLAPVPQDPPTASLTEPDDEEVDLGEIVVTGQRPRGSVQGDIEPDIVLDAEALRTYGAGNIEELLTALEPLTRSNRGRGDNPPITLLNGRRVSGFREIRGIPFEAIERTEILREEVALTYGYTADQRVVNIVLKPQFNAVTVQGRIGGPTQGGRTSTELEGNYFRIDQGTRYVLDIERSGDSAVFEDEREIDRFDADRPFSLAGTLTGSPLGVVTVPASAENGVPVAADFIPGAVEDDATAFRTLLPRQSGTEISGSVTRDLNSTTSGTVRASIEDTSSYSYLGLPGVTLTIPGGAPGSPFAEETTLFRYLNRPESLDRQVDTLEAEVATVLDGFFGDWRWTFTGNYTRTETETETGRGLDTRPLQAAVTARDPSINPFGPLPVNLLPPLADDTARSVSQLLSGEVVFAGDLYDLPAGGINTTITVGADTRSLDSESFRSGVDTETSLSRDRARVLANMTLPIAERDGEFLGWIGDLSLNANVGYEELSDFGGLATLGGGVNWSPVEPLSLNASFTLEDGAPSIQQLNNPLVLTPNVQIFDFATGQTVTVTRTDGGNPDLLSDSRTVLRGGFNLRPWSERDLTFSSNYTYQKLEDQVASFPTITPDLEAAFPERFVRDDTGQLISFDARPVNFAEAERQEIRTGLNFSMPFGTPTPQTERGGDGQDGPRTGGRRGGGGRGPGGGMGMQGPPGGGGPGGGFRGGGRGGRGAQQQPGQGRFNISLFHTVRLQDEITIRENLPVIDLLDGGAVGGSGGQPRNEIQLQGGVFRNGFGTFVNANWREGTRVDGGTGGQDLFFADRTTVNLNAFVDFNQREAWIERFPFLESARVNIQVQNLFDERQDVTDANGVTPAGYERDRLDPLGRVVSINFRKLF
jgi:hypothetical protein